MIIEMSVQLSAIITSAATMARCEPTSLAPVLIASRSWYLMIWISAVCFNLVLDAVLIASMNLSCHLDSLVLLDVVCELFYAFFRMAVTAGAEAEQSNSVLSIIVPSFFVSVR